jgi:hypothetical protein
MVSPFEETMVLSTNRVCCHLCLPAFRICTWCMHKFYVNIYTYIFVANNACYELHNYLLTPSVTKRLPLLTYKHHISPIRFNQFCV